MAYQSYERLNEKYRKDVTRNFVYLTQEISTEHILPHLRGVLHESDYQQLRRRSQNTSDWSCNQDLLSCLQKREYWWRAFREALVRTNNEKIIERLGWNENTFDFGPRDEPVEQNSGASYKPSEKSEKLSKKQQTLEEFTQQKMDVYKKQSNLSKGLNPTTDENNQPEEGRADPNLFTKKSEPKKLNIDLNIEVTSDENDLGKVLEPEIHPAVRQNLPMNFSNSDKEEKLSKYNTPQRPERSPRNANESPTSNSPQGVDKISNVPSLRSDTSPPKLDHSISAPIISTKPGAAIFPPNDSPVTRPVPIRNVPTSAFHHSLSVPSMNQNSSADAKEELEYSKQEKEDNFESSLNQAEQSTLLVRPTSDQGANFEPRNGGSNAETPEIDLREQNLELNNRLKDKDESNADPGSRKSYKSEDIVYDGQATAFPEIDSQACQSNMESMTTNNDVIKPSIASTVDPKGVSRGDNVRDEIAINLKSPNLNREPNSYVTGLHSYGSDVTSLIQSGDQSSFLSQEILDRDQTDVKQFDSVTRVDAFDNFDLDTSSIHSNSSDLDPSYTQSPDAMRLVSGSVASVSRATADLTASSGMDDIHHHNALAQNPALTQNAASAQNPGSAQIPDYAMPKFDSLLSRSHQSLPGNLVMSDLPFSQAANSNVPDLAELLSMGSSVDPTESDTFTPVSVSHPPPSGQLVGLEREPGTERPQDQEDAVNGTALNEDKPPPSLLRRMWNSFGRVVEKVVPLDDCSG